MINIAIDGPSGAGKSTMAKRIAKELNFLYLDTGAMYRAFALYILENENSIEGLEKEKIKDYLQTFNLEILYEDGEQRMIVNKRDVTDRIRTPEISLAASRVSAIPLVRLALVDIQRDIASKNNVIMDGRDIGSFVLKDANVKIFLTASAKDRAERRFKELRNKGNKEISYQEVLDDMILRDKNDSERDFAPLIKVDDAILIETSGLEIEESLDIIRRTIKEKLCLL